jgi:plastocyanin
MASSSAVLVKEPDRTSRSGPPQGNSRSSDMRLDRSFRHASLLLIVGFVAGCGGTTDPDPDPDPLILASVSGNDQSATEGQAAADPLVVRVTRGGNSVVGTTVSWSVTDGGGSVNPTSSATDNGGMASTTWTLGAAAGDNGVQASVSGANGSPVAFTATGLGPPLQQAAVTVGNNFFDPTSSRVVVGGSVTWTWAGGVGHNVTFSSGTSQATQTTGTLDRDFPDAGSFDYQCTIHPAQMQGTIVVG